MRGDNRLRVACIGAGGVGDPQHLPNRAKIPAVEVIAVRNRLTGRGCRVQVGRCVRAAIAVQILLLPLIVSSRV